MRELLSVDVTEAVEPGGKARGRLRLALRLHAVIGEIELDELAVRRCEGFAHERDAFEAVTVTRTLAAGWQPTQVRPPEAQLAQCGTPAAREGAHEPQRVDTEAPRRREAQCCPRELELL